MSKSTKRALAAGLLTAAFSMTTYWITGEPIQRGPKLACAFVCTTVLSVLVTFGVKDLSE